MDKPITNLKTKVCDTVLVGAIIVSVHSAGLSEMIHVLKHHFPLKNCIFWLGLEKLVVTSCDCVPRGSWLKRNQLKPWRNTNHAMPMQGPEWFSRTPTVFPYRMKLLFKEPLSPSVAINSYECLGHKSGKPCNIFLSLREHQGCIRQMQRVWGRISLDTSSYPAWVRISLSCDHFMHLFSPPCHANHQHIPSSMFANAFTSNHPDRCLIPGVAANLNGTSSQWSREHGTWSKPGGGETQPRKTG